MDAGHIAYLFANVLTFDFNQTTGINIMAKHANTFAKSEPGRIRRNSRRAAMSAKCAFLLDGLSVKAL